MPHKRKKFCLTNETVEDEGRTLYRIQALVDIPEHGISKGDFGGFVESEKNLCHRGTCWIGPTARVMDKAKVSERAIAFGNAHLSERAKLRGHAAAYGSARLSGDVDVTGTAHICGQVVLSEQVAVEGAVVLSGDAHLKGNLKIGGEGEVTSFFNTIRADAYGSPCAPEVIPANTAKAPKVPLRPAAALT